MTAAACALSLRATRRRRGRGGDAFLLDVPAFDVAAGTCLAVTGPSGSGKSTLLDLLGLVLRPDSAERFCVRDATGAAIDVAALWARGDLDTLAGIRARAIGYVLQTGGLLPFLTVRDNVCLPRRLLGLPAEDALVARLAGALGLRPLWHRKPRTLSVGERQRAAVARALAHRPALLLADEPTAALDPAQARTVMQLLVALAGDLGCTAVIVTHDRDLVQHLGLPEARPAPLGPGEGPGARFSR